MTQFYDAQQQVDDWIKNTGVRYFNEMTNLSNLMEETGELASLMGRVYGEQRFKKGKAPECPKTAIADELTDVLFIILCLANQMEIDLDESFKVNMDKKTNRDLVRHLRNEKINSRNPAIEMGDDQ